MARTQSKLRAPRIKKGAVTLLVGTRKGVFFVKSDAQRKKWTLRGPDFLGHVVHHAVLDPRDRKTMLLAVRTGHLGPTIFRSEDGGKHWKEARKPPAFTEAAKGLAQRTVDHVFWLSPGHVDEPGVWYAGTSPQGLFRSRDGGQDWKPVKGFNNNPDIDKWTGGPKDGTPDGGKLHSITLDPRNKNQIYIGMSGGGVFESRNGGRSWKPLNAGCAADFLPVKDPEYGHDPHCVSLAPMDPDRLWQQNHCGIYRMDRGESDVWQRVGDNMPKAVGDVGFPIVLHPRDPETAWVFPMDGTSVWPRTSPGGQPAAYRTRDGGATWQRQGKGMPTAQAWWTVKRQCMAQDSHDSLGLYFGTTSGEVWGSTNEGRSWNCLARHLPHVYSVEVAGVHQ